MNELLAESSDYSFGIIKQYEHPANEKGATLEERRHMLDVQYFLAKSAVQKIIPNFI